MTTLKLTQRDVPDGSVIGVLSDIHVPHHDEPAVRLAIDCLERAGVTHVLLNGDIADCGPASRHEGKRRAAVLDEGSLRESVEPGEWIFKWARTRTCWYILGNHERWVEDAIAQSAELVGTPPTTLLGLPDDSQGWTVLPSKSRLRLGSRVWEHGDALFPSGAGGANPGARVKSLAPDQSTSIGHLHRRFSSCWTTPDENGVPRTRAVYGNGHLSNPAAHESYAGSYASWQQSFEITRVYYVDGKPRFTTDQPEIHRDKRGKPYLEYQGKVHRS